MITSTSFSASRRFALTLHVAFVFLQSLFFKFTGALQTVCIFQGQLEPWPASLGFPGV